MATHDTSLPIALLQTQLFLDQLPLPLDDTLPMATGRFLAAAGDTVRRTLISLGFQPFLAAGTLTVQRVASVDTDSDVADGARAVDGSATSGSGPGDRDSGPGDPLACACATVSARLLAADFNFATITAEVLAGCVAVIQTACPWLTADQLAAVQSIKVVSSIINPCRHGSRCPPCQTPWPFVGGAAATCCDLSVLL